MIRVLIAEDHSLVRSGIRALLEKSGDILVVGEAANGEEAVQRAIELKPDVIIMDIMMPRLNGIQAVAQIRELKLPSNVIFLSMYADEGLVRQVILSGANGYLLKSSVSEELSTAVRAAMCNQIYLSRAVADIKDESQGSFNNANQPLDLLSPREKEILQLIAEEYTSNEIAEKLFISPKTVEKHRASLMMKLKVRNVAGLVRLAIKYGVTDTNRT